MVERKRIVILGAAGRDFHNFNVFYRNDPSCEVVAFTATQIPDIAGRAYPPALAGPLYPKGIPIVAEEELTTVIKSNAVDEAVFSYSDVSHEHVMHKASQSMAAGASFTLLSPSKTMICSSKPVVAVCAVRTGSGKSQTTRKMAKMLQNRGLKVAVVRHPMPYGDLAKQEVQRFSSIEDLKKHECTIEEMEEYEPHLSEGIIVYSGVDYEKILRQAEKEADVILWDGGNNDTPFYKPDLHVVVADPLRAGHETLYHPGETNFRMADVIIINKVDSATPEQVKKVKDNAAKLNPSAKVIEAESEVTVDNAEAVRGKRVLVVEDGPTLTHGDMTYGAGVVAARKFGAAELVNPRPFAVGSIKETYLKYPQSTQVLPAMGYGEKQVKELEETINTSDADLVVVGTPIDLRRIVKMNKPAVRVQYNLKEKESLEPLLDKLLGK